jgi:hypothetical protein
MLRSSSAAMGTREPSDDIFPLADHWHRIVAEEVSAA